MQPETRRPGLVATDDLLGQSFLFPGPLQKVSRLETLRRLRLGPVHHAHHHDAGGMDVQRQLDLPVLGWRRNFHRGGLACDLRSAGLSGRTRFVTKHSAGGRSSLVARPPAFMPSISFQFSVFSFQFQLEKIRQDHRTEAGAWGQTKASRKLEFCDTMKASPAFVAREPGLLTLAASLRGLNLVGS